MTLHYFAVEDKFMDASEEDPSIHTEELQILI